MLIPTNQGYLGTPLAGTAEIENLQRALKNLATATQRPAIDPGPVTGTMNDATMIAINSGLNLLTESLPSWAYLALQAAFVAGATTSTAKQYASQYASQLTIAANTAAVKYRKDPVPAPMPTQPTIVGFFAPGWYKTPIGLALIAFGAFMFWKFVLSPRQGTKEA